VPTWAEIEQEARRLVGGAADRGAVLRVVGSTAIRLRSPHAATLMDRAERRPKDIDVICRKRDRAAVRELFEASGYDVDRDMLVAMEGTRYAYRHPGTAVELDVFVDQLEFCHTLDLRDRLERHDATIPPEDLLLQKLQIVTPTAGDTVDAIVLLADDAGALDTDYVAGLLARDWGFHRTATGNLERVRSAATGGPAPPGLDAGVLARVAATSERLLAAIDAAPKTLAWRARARIGERRQWWQDVHDERAAY
jgi:hypothetical protein